MRSLSNDLEVFILSPVENNRDVGLFGDGGGRSAPEEDDEPSIFCMNFRPFLELDGEPDRVEELDDAFFVSWSCAASFSAAACKLCGWWYCSMEVVCGASELFLC